MILTQNQEQALIKRLLDGRDDKQYRDLFQIRTVRNVYTPPTRGVDGSNEDVPKN